MEEVDERPSPAPGLMFGIGLGGFVDGIVLHQILQWHHMVSAERSPATVAGLEVNTLADGFFHAATWLIVVGASIVTIALWRQGRLAPSWTFHVGGLLAGWACSTWPRGWWTTRCSASTTSATTSVDRSAGTSRSSPPARSSQRSGGC